MPEQRRKSVFKKKQTHHVWRNSLIALAVVLVIIITIVGVRKYYEYEAELPSLELIHNIEPSLNTKIYDRNGILLKEYFSENRVLTPLDEMPPYLPEMLIASEDLSVSAFKGLTPPI